MSVQFGRWNFDGQPVERDYLAKVEPLLAVYGPDDVSCYAKCEVAIFYHAFHTTRESRNERQPHLASSGLLLLWDGRLDNREELISELSGRLKADSTDLEIVAAALDAWKLDCLGKLLGDWALSIWDSVTRTLVLAKDCMGARPLYYSFNASRIIWSTVLDPLLLLTEDAPRLSEEYIAGWISSFPDSSLSPFLNIRSVPPCSVVQIRRGSVQTSKYWDFDPGKIIRYHHDSDYEEHFRTVFCDAVRRRLRSQNPILAELSGGMDSSSIVCVADPLLARGAGETPRMDTLSYFDDSEPNWNERIYFQAVEEKRGRAGYHIDVGGEQYFEINQDCGCFPSTPAAAGHSRRISSTLADHLNFQGTRVLLSGIGGDEVLGGVPTAIPELADLIADGSFLRLGRQLNEWALSKRKPWLHLLFQTIDRFLPRFLVSTPLANWLHSDFVRRNLTTLVPHFHRIDPLGPRPSFQIGLHTLDGLRNQLACLSSPSMPIFETRYPFLDRSLLEFVFSIPREQLVRPGERRSLMRRALTGIVPKEILDRRRKAFMRGPLIAATTDWPVLLRNSGPLHIEELGVVNTNNLISTLENARGHSNVPVVPLIRMLTLERWLRSLSLRNILPILPQG